MHIVLVIVGGLLLGLVFGLFGHLWGGTPTGMAAAFRAFLPTWLVLTAVNMWIGVSRAGYSVAQELPLQIVVFAVPAVAALGCLRLLAR